MLKLLPESKSIYLSVIVTASMHFRIKHASGSVHMLPHLIFNNSRKKKLLPQFTDDDTEP